MQFVLFQHSGAFLFAGGKHLFHTCVSLQRAQSLILF